MTKEQIFQRVKSFLELQLSIDGDSIHMDSHFIDDLNADSLDIVELVMTLEQEFDLAIPDEEAERISTVGDAVDFIHRSL